MAAKVIDGKALAATVRQAFKRRTDSLIEAGLRPDWRLFWSVTTPLHELICE